MNILMVWARFFPEMGGIETHMYEVGKRLQADGHRVTILTTDRSGTLPAKEIVSDMDVVRVRAWPRNSDIYLAPGVAWAILRSRWDVIHIQGYHTLVAPLAMIAAWLSRQMYVITFHSGGHSSAVRRSLRGLQHRILRPLVRRAAQRIGVSEYEAATFSRTMKIDPAQFMVIPNGVTPFTAPARSLSTTDTIVSIGRLERYKGHHRAIEAFAHLLPQKPHTDLHIVGAGPYREELIELAHRLGVEDHVHIYAIDPSDRERLMDTVGNASLVVLLSDYEAHPVAVMEALSLRRKVLATHCSGFIELAARDWISTVPPEANADEIANAMLQAMEDPCCADVRLPSWDNAAHMIENVYGAVARA